MRFYFWVAAVAVAAVATGCLTKNITNTARSSEEQLLCTRAVDLALEKVTFIQVSDRKVFVDNKLLNSVDKEYVLGALRQKLALSGGILIDDKKESDIVVEVFSGCVGTSYTTWLAGIPKSGLPIPLAGTLTIPEIAFYKRERQGGSGKIGITMLDNKTGKSVLDVPLLFGEAYYNRFIIMFIPFSTSNTFE
ncbi:hypothetical protein P0136_04725 [Lentisphaerota bacterium ZTH]|nr:hypothetical protein JYG24_04155 [Lentisphaerota bacterium]WET07294.1 hypothetical protein P0136_04725 [Lentisphaerota bacterium ZTH]